MLTFCWSWRVAHREHKIEIWSSSECVTASIKLLEHLDWDQTTLRVFQICCTFRVFQIDGAIDIYTSLFMVSVDAARMCGWEKMESTISAVNVKGKPWLVSYPEFVDECFMLHRTLTELFVNVRAHICICLFAASKCAIQSIKTNSIALYRSHYTTEGDFDTMSGDFEHLQLLW